VDVNEFGITRYLVEFHSRLPNSLSRCANYK
jgi:hypothetical protein